MNSELLTIVIPTRDRPYFLEKCLRSVFECQRIIPKVIVSDNSTSYRPAMEVLRGKYSFAYVRQSGDLSMTEHWNTCCLELSSTRWVLMLHDDDELYPNSIDKLVSFLADCEDVGIVIGGIQLIDQQGKVHAEWIPKVNGKFRGEDGLLRLGLDWGVRPPGIVVSVPASLQGGGFVDIGGIPADYAFALRLAYSHGVAFFPQLVGCYRSGPQQCTDYSTPEKAEAWLEFSIRQAELIHTLGCSVAAADQIVDCLTWWTFLTIASRWFSHHSFVLRLTQKCLRLSPRGGEWQNRVRRRYPFLFWRRQWLAWPFLALFRFLRLVRKLRRHLLKRLAQ